MAAEAGHAWWAFVLLGVGAGLLSGSLGVGSGTILIPALVLGFSFGQKSAQGTALAVMVPMALVGALRYWQNPAIPVDLRIVGLTALGAVGGTLVGAQAAHWLPGDVLRKVFAVFVILVGLRLLVPAREAGPGPRPDGTAVGQPQETEAIRASGE